MCSVMFVCSPIQKGIPMPLCTESKQEGGPTPLAGGKEEMERRIPRRTSQEGPRQKILITKEPPSHLMSQSQVGEPRPRSHWEPFSSPRLSHLNRTNRAFLY